MYSSLISSETESASNVCTFEAESSNFTENLTFDSNSTSDIISDVLNCENITFATCVIRMREVINSSICFNREL